MIDFGWNWVILHITTSETLENMVSRCNVCKFIFIYFFEKISYLVLSIYRYYYANVDKTRENVQLMINEGKWDNKEFPELRKDLLSKLNISNSQHNSNGWLYLYLLVYKSIYNKSIIQ